MSNEFDSTLLEEDATPLTIAEDVIQYLINQNAVDAEDERFLQTVANFTEHHIPEIVEELLQRYKLTYKIKQVREAQAKAHNQHELFNLRKVIPNFNIDDKMYDLLTFREHLIVYTFQQDSETESDPVGGLCLDVQKAMGCPPAKRKTLNVEEKIHQILRGRSCNMQIATTSVEGDKNSREIKILCGDYETGHSEISVAEEDELDDLEIQRAHTCSKFLVHVSSEFDVDGFYAGSRITSWVDRKAHTLEELRREFLSQRESKAEYLIQKTLYCGLLKGCYYVKHCSTSESVEDRKFYSLLKTHNFISEGSNFLLYRYLAVTQYVGSFEMSAMYINGDMCRNIYECFGSETMVINGREMQVCRINRNIIEECGLEHKCVTILSPNGQILKQNWEGISYCLRVNPLAVINVGKPVGNERILFKNAWEKDMQLVSKYLDEKTTNSMKMKSYMLHDHSEFKMMMSDYINSILRMKPEDIIDFTANHFLSFAPQYAQHNEYFN